MDTPHDLAGRVEATCKWLESGTSVLTTDMAHDIRVRISELEAKNERLTEDRGSAYRAADKLLTAKNVAEAELKKYKWMLDESLLDDHYSDRDDLELRWAARAEEGGKDE